MLAAMAHHHQVSVPLLLGHHAPLATKETSSVMNHLAIEPPVRRGEIQLCRLAIARSIERHSRKNRSLPVGLADCSHSER